jgi:hypothetical protein
VLAETLGKGLVALVEGLAGGGRLLFAGDPFVEFRVEGLISFFPSDAFDFSLERVALGRVSGGAPVGTVALSSGRAVVSAVVPPAGADLSCPIDGRVARVGTVALSFGRAVVAAVVPPAGAGAGLSFPAEMIEPPRVVDGVGGCSTEKASLC